MKPKITIAHKSGTAALFKRMANLSRTAAYVGVPSASSRERSDQLLGMAAKTKNKRKKEYLRKTAEADVTNAELLFIFSKGSPKRRQPARPVLEPAVQAAGNKEPISRELAGMAKAALEGDREKQMRQAKRAALAGQNAARGWFTDARNGWQPLAESTKRGRMSRMSKAQRAEAAELGDAAFTPGVDTGAMRASIIGIVSEE